MILAVLWAALALPPPPTAPPGVPVTPAAGGVPALREWTLGGALRIKQENFLRWEPIAAPGWGFGAELRLVWRIEVESPRLPLVLTLESAPATPASWMPGVAQARLQIKLPGDRARLGLAQPIVGSFNSSARPGEPGSARSMRGPLGAALSIGF